MSENEPVPNNPLCTENSLRGPFFNFSFLLQIARGLHHCHNQQVAHLDLKPANVLVTSTGQCKLADFGCSRKFEKDQMLNVEACPPGTPGYQAPELLKERQVHLKSDIYSLGIMIWQLVTQSSQPYPGWHAHTIIYQVAAQDVRPKKTKNSKCVPYESSGHDDQKAY